MQPAIRKLKILEAIVDSYIGTGEPVGSKTLCDGLDFNVSSATIRNDMSELAELGLLTQPHTSSGRVPTNLGYRIYVDKLMSVKPVSPKEQGAIKASLYSTRTLLNTSSARRHRFFRILQDMPPL